MRDLARRECLLRFLAELGRRVKGPGRLYLTGGASAILKGWRESTVDIDLSFGVEPAGAFEAIRDLKNELNLNIELASPADFIPALPGWVDRSPYIDRFGQLDVYHFDFYCQALSKIERDHHQDRIDVDAMLKDGLIEPRRLRELYDSIESELIRFPSLEPASLRESIEEWIKRSGALE